MTFTLWRGHSFSKLWVPKSCSSVEVIAHPSVVQLPNAVVLQASV